MGLFSIRGENLDAIQAQIWFPDLQSPRGLLEADEYTRVMSQPGFKTRHDDVLANTDSMVEVFELNKTVRGEYGVAAGERPGIVGRMTMSIFEVHVPIRRHLFDDKSMSVQEVELPELNDDPYVYGLQASRMAAAKAIQAYVANPNNNQ